MASKGFKTKVKDTGARRIKALAKDIKKNGPFVKVGFLKGPMKDGGQTVAGIAAIHEFGEGNMPERSFMRSTINNNRKEYAKIIKSLFNKVVLGRMTQEKALGLLGLRIQSDMVKKILTNIPPQTKASGISLVDTGQLKASLRHKVEKK